MEDNKSNNSKDGAAAMN